MANIYKTARGQVVDMGKLKLANETAVAVGNMRVNARGDQLGAGGKVIAGRNQIMDKVYAVPDAGYSPNDPATFAALQVEASGPKQISDLVNNLNVEIQPTDEKNQTVPATRGSLADSIAKNTTVIQKPLPTPQEKQRSNGPSRI